MVERMSGGLPLFVLHAMLVNYEQWVCTYIYYSAHTNVTADIYYIDVYTDHFPILCLSHNHTGMCMSGVAH